MITVNKSLTISDVVALEDIIEKQSWGEWKGKVMGFLNPIKILQTSRESIKKILNVS